MDSRFSIVRHAFDTLARSGQIVTSNERAARWLRRELGPTLTSPGDVLTVSAWVAQQWNARIVAGAESRIPMSAQQELRLWQKTLEADEELQTLLPVSKLAEMARDAARQVYDFNARGRLGESSATGDSAAFMRWIRAFEARCVQDGWIPASALASALADAVEAGEIARLSREVLVVGFDRILPSQAQLLNALSARGCVVTHAATREAEEARLAACADASAELAACAGWVAEVLATTPAGRIAVVHPDVQGARNAIERALREHVAPEMHHISASNESAPFEFSLGTPMASTGMVRHALLLLHWLAAPIDAEAASEVLRSPYLGSAESIFPRSEFDSFGFRRNAGLQAEVPLADVLDLLAKASDLQDFRAALIGAQTLAKTASKLEWMEWAEHVAELLRIAGWPGEMEAGSEAYQLLNRWQELLDEMAQMQMLGERVSWGTMLDTLQRTASATLFSPESHDAVVQVLGPLEAAGSEFGAMWFLQADDLHWPAAAAPHAFLPFGLQCEFGMPGADGAADFEFSLAATKRLLGSAKTIVVSYAQHTADGQHARCSRLFSHISHAFPSALREATVAPVKLETLPDDESMPLPAYGTSLGGANLLEAQAACPFRAFAERRLFSEAPGDVAHGMDAGERGSVLHGVLQQFWTIVPDHAQLTDISKEKVPGEETERDRILRQCIDAELGRNRAHAWERAYLKVEADRLHALLSRWLDMELERTPFTVEAVEQTLRDVEIGPLKLDLRVDRIDRVHTPHGDRLLVIDYKTGQAKPAEWDTDRPDKPQLPLYAAVAHTSSQPRELAGIAYAGVRAGKDGLSLKGVAVQDGMLPAKNAVDYAERLPEWQRVLGSLANEFAEGTAEIDPKRHPHTCAYCQQRILCRLDPGTLVLLEEDEDAMEESL